MADNSWTGFLITLTVALEEFDDRDISKQIEKFLEMIEKCSDVEDGISVYTGYAGQTLIFLHLYEKEADPNLREKYLKSAVKLAGKSLDEKRLSRMRKNERITFIEGVAGPLAINAVLNFQTGKQEKRFDWIYYLIN